MQVGKDVYIAPRAVFRRPNLVTIGSHVAIDDFFYCTTAFEIGDYIHISPMVSIIGGADGTFRAGHFTTISAGARIIVRGDEHNGRGLVGPLIPDEFRDKVVGKEIVIESFSSVGTNAILLPNTRLAEGVVVGAGSVVTKSILEPWTIWIGSPARKLKDRPREQMILNARSLGYDI